eukprot:TRINITY_DN10921_c0_g1_i1.p2 TRINITY_DN10921_c0_g1~~TRINITY_DN10921_c0_g1_i1.p2  ORF type:complete len:113 (+),score=13.63 TRINITY_DN10921_c0_g1_i1:57-395(+)
MLRRTLAAAARARFAFVPSPAMAEGGLDLGSSEVRQDFKQVSIGRGPEASTAAGQPVAVELSHLFAVADATMQVWKKDGSGPVSSVRDGGMYFVTGTNDDDQRTRPENGHTM